MSDYVRGLRERLGPDQLILLPGVSVFIWDHAGRLLLVQDAQTGLWQTVGGTVEPDEHPREAALREAEEETGLQVRLDGIRGVSGGPEFRHTYPNGDRVAFVGTSFNATAIGGELLVDGDGDETSAARWWRIDGLENAAMSPLTRRLLAMMDVLPAD